jgi:hypothetical protein
MAAIVAVPRRSPIAAIARHRPLRCIGHSQRGVWLPKYYNPVTRRRVGVRHPQQIAVSAQTLLNLVTIWLTGIDPMRWLEHINLC